MYAYAASSCLTMVRQLLLTIGGDSPTRRMREEHEVESRPEQTWWSRTGKANDKASVRRLRFAPSHSPIL